MKAKKTLIFLLFTISTIVWSCKKDKKLETIPTVTTNVPTNVTTTTASITGKITNDGNATISEAGFVYSNIVAEPTTADNKIIVTNFDTFMADLSGLASGKTYKIRAYAINSQGIGYGEMRTFETGNQAPIVTNILITGDTKVNSNITVNYTYTDAEADVEAGTTYQWYVANDVNGTGEAAIIGATSKTFRIQEGQNGKYLRVSVTPKAASGTMVGAEVSSPIVGAIGEATTVTFTYDGQEVTYGIIIGTSGRKWLDRNIGAMQVATKIDDYLAYGDLFQWGRKADGHQRIIRTGSKDGEATGKNGITSTQPPYQTSDDDTPTTNKFIINGGNPPGDWRTTANNTLWQGNPIINNPCPAGWKIPSRDEWIAENLGTPSNAFTKLKLVFTGRRNRTTGSIEFSENAYYWTSTSRVFQGNPFSIYINFSATQFTPIDNFTFQERGVGHACRCIKE